MYKYSETGLQIEAWRYKDAAPEILRALKLLSDNEKDSTGEDSTDEDVESCFQILFCML